jgi:hypothetical protein
MTTTLHTQRRPSAHTSRRRASPRGPRPRPHERATDTNAEYSYDYAGDDPINNIDPTGMLSFCDVGSWLSPLVGAGCNRHVQHLVRHHYEQIVEFGGGCLAGARIGAWYGTVVPVLGEATPIAGGVTGCLIGGAAGLYGGEQAIPEKP